ncbi:hypothetical protein D3C87_1878540 [compost metagenome]
MGDLDLLFLVEERNLDLVSLRKPAQRTAIPLLRVAERFVQRLNLAATRDNELGRTIVKVRIQEVAREL